MTKGKAYKSTTVQQSAEQQQRLVKRVGQAVVFVVTMASTVLSFTTFGVSWTAIVITTLTVLLLVSVLMNWTYFIDQKQHRKRAKHIAFLTPSSGDQPFYAAMLNGMVKNASLALGQNYIMIPSMPTESFETVSIWALFASLEDRQLEIDGIIFIPDQPDRHFDELVGFHEDRGDVPLVLVDVYFDLRTCDDRTRARLPSFVGGDEKAGGELAAGILMDAVAAHGQEPPTVLVINGGTAPWEQQRAVHLRKKITARWPETRFIESPPFNYSRSAAFKYFIDFVRSHADTDRRIAVDAIFACNDDMAIGARGAISRAIREGYSFHRPPQIVGYDGIVEIREYIDADDLYIAGTVDVRIDEQAKAAVLLMHKLVRSGQRRSEVQLIVPEAVRRAGVGGVVPGQVIR